MSVVDEVLHNMAIRCPGFAAFLEERRSGQTRADGSLSMCGAFFLLTDYMDEHHTELDEHQQRAFWEWIDWQVESGDEELAEVSVTCFLENITDTPVETHGREFMPERIKKWLDDLAGRGRRTKRWFEK